MRSCGAKHEASFSRDGGQQTQKLLFAIGEPWSVFGKPPYAHSYHHPRRHNHRPQATMLQKLPAPMYWKALVAWDFACGPLEDYRGLQYSLYGKYGWCTDLWQCVPACGSFGTSLSPFAALGAPAAGVACTAACARSGSTKSGSAETSQRTEERSRCIVGSFSL